MTKTEKFVMRITEGGYKCAFSSSITSQVVSRPGVEGGNEITTYVHNAEELDALKNITLRAIQMDADEASIKRFADYCRYLAKDKTEPEFNLEFWQSFLVTFLDTISAELTNLVLTERFFAGSKTLLQVMNQRMPAWKKLAGAKIEKDQETGAVNITFGDW